MFTKNIKPNKIAIAFYALFLNAQLFKTMPVFADLGLDLTIVSLVVSLAFLGLHSLHSKFIFPLSFHLILIIFLFSSTFGYNDSFTTDYASEKYLRFHLLTLFAAIAPLFIITTVPILSFFLRSLVFFWVIYCLISFVGVYFADSAVNRASTFSESEIFLGRSAGGLLLISVILFFEKKIKPISFITLLFILLVLLIASGTKASILATLLLSIVYMLLFLKVNRLVFFLSFISIVVYISIPYIIDHIPSESIARILLFINGDIGEGSGQIRLEMWGDSINYSLEHIWGTGLGGFSGIDRKYALFEYPHNIIIEYLLEVGIMPVVIFIIAIATSIRMLYKQSKRTNILSIKISFILLLFFFIQALISGDLDGNRLFFAFFAIGLLMPAFIKRARRASNYRLNKSKAK